MQNETVKKAAKNYCDFVNKTKTYYQANKKNTKNIVRVLQKFFRR